MLAIFDVCGLSKIVSAKCAPRGLIITKVTVLLMDCEAMKGGYNQGIKQEFLSQKSSDLNLTSDSLSLHEYQIKQIVKKLLLSLRVMAQHHNGAIRNDSLLRPGPRTLRLFGVKSTYDIDNTYCQSISAEILLC